MLKPYESYKKTDQLWLDQIPNNWSSIKIKHLFNERTQKGYPEEQLLVASQNMGVVPKNVYGNRTVEATKDLHLLKLVKVGDFVISLRSFQGGIEYAYYQGIISPAYTVMIPQNLINPHYFRHLAKSNVFIELLTMCVTGIREGQNVDYNKLKNHKLPIPPRKEQDQIVRYLDWQIAKINKLVSAKKRQIKLLKEQKQAVINKAVTKGIDDNLQMKDSGVEWLGKVPVHWEVRKLRTIAKTQFQYGANESGIPFTAENPRYIRITDIDLQGNLKDEGKLSLPSDIATPYILEDGDILFARSGATVGKSFIFKKCYETSAFAGYLIRYKPNKNLVVPEFVYNFTLGSGYVFWISQIFIQATIQNISAEKYKNLQIAVPSLKEQKSIVDYITNITEKIDTIIKETEKEIELLSEYKQSLVSSVVTGKVDVRGVVVPKFVVDDSNKCNNEGEVLC